MNGIVLPRDSTGTDIRLSGVTLSPSLHPRVFVPTTASTFNRRISDIIAWRNAKGKSRREAPVAIDRRGNDTKSKIGSQDVFKTNSAKSEDSILDFVWHPFSQRINRLDNSILLTLVLRESNVPSLSISHCRFVSCDTRMYGCMVAGCGARG